MICRGDMNIFQLDTNPPHFQNSSYFWSFVEIGGNSLYPLEFSRDLDTLNESKNMEGEYFVHMYVFVYFAYICNTQDMTQKSGLTYMYSTYLPRPKIIQTNSSLSPRDM